VNPDNEGEKVTIYICVPNVVFNEDKLQAKFGQHSSEKGNFVNDVKSFVLSYDKDTLKKKVERDGGALRFKLNDQAVELVYKEDFYFGA